jgi:hypothetical protein
MLEMRAALSGLDAAARAERRTAMRLRARDVIALVLVAAAVVPYVGYLIEGEMPLISSTREMASTGIFFGALAFWIIRGGNRPGRLGRIEAGLAVLAVTLYVVTIALAATAAADLLLAAFMLAVVVVFAVDLLDQSGTQQPAGHLR